MRARRSWPQDIVDAPWPGLDSHRWERDEGDDRSQVRARAIGGAGWEPTIPRSDTNLSTIASADRAAAWL